MTEKERADLKAVGEIIIAFCERFDADVVSVVYNDVLLDEKKLHHYLRAIRDLNYLESPRLKYDIENYEKYNSSIDE